MASGFLSVTEFAVELGVSTSTARRMIKTGSVITSQVAKNHTIRIPFEEIERRKTGVQSYGCTPVLRGGESKEEKQTKKPLPGPKPRWQRRLDRSGG